MYIAKYYSEYPESPGNILLNELIKINKKGVKVEIILNREDRKNASGLTQDNMNTGAYLAQNGVPVYFDPGNKTTHAKLLVIDEKFVVLGSTNWTYYAFTQNNETSLLIESEPLAKHYLKYFFDLKTKSTLLSKPAE
jgi:phosphatidylserine/phosphatidylglycerophosphate/cardiolipin synthase-like enzyme